MKLFMISMSFVITLFTPLTQAQELPLWEVGAGFTGLSLPEYRGADRQRLLLLPLPYLVYRGKLLRVDRKGVYGLLFESDRMRLNMSFDAGPPVRSSGNSIRTGMSELDPSVQIGPSLEVCLVDDCDGDNAVQFRLPVRAVYAVKFIHLHRIGLVVNPQLNLDMKNIGRGAWNLGFALGPIFATRQYHRYYYSVSPASAVPDVRSAYDAQGGYSGTALVLALSKRFQHTWFGAFGRYDELAGAVFSDSPLVRTRHSYMAGIGLAWVFDESSLRVHASP